MSFLQTVLAKKRERIKEEMHQTPLSQVEAVARAQRPAKDFRGSLLRSKPGIIAEFKRSSPSRGVIRHDRDPLWQAGQYAQGGADAISVLTEQDFFHGDPDDLRRIAAADLLPVLRKDFIFHPYQIIQARALGADAVLFIWRVLGSQGYRELYPLAHELGLTVLLEVGDEAELEEALAFKPVLLGINNRNLDTLEVNPETTTRLLQRIPKEISVVGESGMKSAADVQRLVEQGVQAVLIGETLMRSEDPASAIRSMRGEENCFESKSVV
jgi:indole-3-glycerol phosphate synthase